MSGNPLLGHPRHRAEHARAVTPPEVPEANEREGNTKPQRRTLGGVEGYAN